MDAERAAIFQAIGRYDEAFTILRNAVERRADFAYWRRWLRFALIAGCGHGRTRISTKVVTTTMGFRRFRWLGAAHRRLPDYAPAQGHLAEVEAALGETDSAIARLRPLTITSDDLDYAAQLARILSEVGRVEEAREWRARTAARYDELLARHPEAFADHAAEFWLQAGADPHRALSLATMNLEVRRTPRAHELLFRASSAVEGARPGSLIPHRDGA